MTLDRAQYIRVVPFVLLLAAFALLLVACLSAPIIRTNTFVRATSAALEHSATIDLGLWGLCTSATGSRAICTGTSLGFSHVSIPNIRGASNVLDALGNGAAFLLILHPIAAGLTLIALVFVSLKDVTPLKARFAHLFALGAAIIAFLALMFDFILFNAVRAAINAATPLNASFGSALYLVLSACILLIVATLALAARHRMISKSGKNGIYT